MINNRFASYFLLAFLLVFINLNSQTFTDSNLPIVIITTDINPATSLPYEIVDDPDVFGTMKIIKRPNGSRNYLTDQNTAALLNYNGRLSIQIRGSSSQDLPKKGYKVTTLLADNVTNNNVALLGMPAENDWILNGLAFDPSLIRDYLAYNLSRQMGNYAPRTQYCEVLINGEYKGLYLLQEKIKADSNRVNILKITTTDISGDNLTGGYITKADKTTGGDPVAWTTIAYNGQDVNYIHDLPKPEDVTTEQDNYIYTQFTNLQTALTGNNMTLLNGYPARIDIPSFVDFMISNDFAANADGYQLSTYFHKDRKGKLRAGPIWDFNLTWGNDLFQYGLDRSKYYTWQFLNGDNEGSKFWRDMFNNAIFKCYLSKRFNQLIQANQPLNTAVLNTFIDNTITLISEAKVRENQKWNTIPNYALEIANLKAFISNRTNWMTNNLGGFASCANVAVPPLVITKINYNPSTSGSFLVSNDLEFIEIQNTGTTLVTLSGIYFSELGMSYQFPYNATIAGNSSLYLASNASVFQSKYGFAPFGQFTRNLSNKSQKIVIADAFGNIIDSVEYFDTSPWPTAADGGGSYLQLTSTSLDNNLGSSWVATSVPLSVSNFDSESAINIYPNPANYSLTVRSKFSIDKIEIYDVFGKFVKAIQGNENEIQTDVSNFSIGMYFMKIYTQYGTKTEKWFKN
ncbi:MAG: CotH kinase family protein [Flavobacterium sp.]|uniref:CotH kinase family protein n=1 Tax=Flavobacterium sp. TaxID=239 RepID=UPI003BC9CE2F